MYGDKKRHLSSKKIGSKGAKRDGGRSRLLVVCVKRVENIRQKGGFRSKKYVIGTRIGEIVKSQ